MSRKLFRRLAICFSGEDIFIWRTNQDDKVQTTDDENNKHIAEATSDSHWKHSNGGKNRLKIHIILIIDLCCDVRSARSSELH